MRVQSRKSRGAGRELRKESEGRRVSTGAAVWKENTSKSSTALKSDFQTPLLGPRWNSPQKLLSISEVLPQASIPLMILLALGEKRKGN